MKLNTGSLGSTGGISGSTGSTGITGSDSIGKQAFGSDCHLPYFSTSVCLDVELKKSFCEYLMNSSFVLFLTYDKPSLSL